MSSSAVQTDQAPVGGAVLGGRFRVVRRIGEGGMGVVLEAENTLTGKRVAVKWMHPQLAQQPGAAERMVREARASARVRHPNVVDVYDVVQEDGAVFLVMELLEGESLTSLIERGGVPPHTVIGYLLDAMRGVAAAHREGVIHRDIKPDNIFLAREPDRAAPTPKVLDFGISKLAGGEGLTLTKTGMTLGTPLYMSYEQLAGVRDIDGRTDVYAFGVILYEVLTGQPPFLAETFSELVIKITTTQPPSPKTLQPSVPGSLSSIVQTAMARERVERTPSLDHLIAELEPYASAEGYAARLTALPDDLSGTPSAWASTVAAPTPASMPAITATPVPAIAAQPSGPAPPTAQAALEDDVRLSSIPRSFSGRTALLWSAAALALAAASAYWLQLDDAPDASAREARPQAALTVETEDRAAPAPSERSERSETTIVAANPASEAPRSAPPTPFEPANIEPASPTPKSETLPIPSRPSRAVPKAVEKEARRPRAPQTSTSPSPTAPTPRAGRPQSQEF